MVRCPGPIWRGNTWSGVLNPWRQYIGRCPGSMEVMYGQMSWMRQYIVRCDYSKVFFVSV